MKEPQVDRVRPSFTAVLFVLFAAASSMLSGCRNSDDDEPQPPTGASLAGRLGVGAASAPGGSVLEQEPNDEPSQVQFVGSLAPGVEYGIAGSTTDDGSDPFDGFRFTISSTAVVDLVLTMLEPGTDVDMFVFDVDAGEVVATFAGTENPELGQFTAEGGGSYDVVVQPFSGTTAYELRVSGSAPTTATMAGSGLALGSQFAWKQPDAEARYLGAHHEMFGERIVVLEHELAHASEARRRFLEREELELLSRTPDGTSLYRLSPLAAARLPRATQGSLTGSLEHHLARKAHRFARQPGVRAASPDYRVRHFGNPNDTHYPLQWHYPQIKLPLAWDLTTGSNGVIVAVIDTGHVPHPDLLPRIVGGYDFISDPATAGDGNGMDPDPTDVGDAIGSLPSSFHGTHVSGTVGARSNNNSGVAGVDWSAGLLSLRALGIGGGSLSDIAAAVRYAARLPNASGQLPAVKADVVNMSLGTTAFSSVLQAACDDARAAGVTLIAAAGNEPNSVLKYPAAFESVIAVGSVRFDRTLAPYSTFGTWIDVVAPGGDMNVDQNGDGYPDGVLSTHADDQGTFFYGFQQGTSMASPHVAGVAALIRAAAPTTTPAQMRDILRSSAQDLGPPGFDATYGHGLVDTLAALLAATNTQLPQPVLSIEPATVSFGSTSEERSVGLANVGPGTIDILGATVTYIQGSGWLSATLVPASAGASISHSELRLLVDRSGLPAGDYAASIALATSLPTGNATVQVLMSVGAGSQPSYTVYVLLVDPETFATVDQAITSLLSSYAWSMSGLPAGSYILVAGTDENDDGFIGDPGEPLFGMWPSAVEPALLVLEEGAQLSNLDFPIGQGQIGTLGWSPIQGFRRR